MALFELKITGDSPDALEASVIALADRFRGAGVEPATSRASGAAGRAPLPRVARPRVGAIPAAPDPSPAGDEPSAGGDDGEVGAPGADQAAAGAAETVEPEAAAPAEDQPTVADASPTETPTETPSGEVTIDQVKAAAVAMSSAKGFDAVQAVFAKHGIDKPAATPADKRAAVLADLTAGAGQCAATAL